jgi:hypothetical protein
LPASSARYRRPNEKLGPHPLVDPSLGNRAQQAFIIVGSWRAQTEAHIGNGLANPARRGQTRQFTLSSPQLPPEQRFATVQLLYAPRPRYGSGPEGDGTHSRGGQYQ